MNMALLAVTWAAEAAVMLPGRLWDEHPGYRSAALLVRAAGIDNQFYDVDRSLRTLGIQLRFKLDRIEFYSRIGSFGLAEPVNLHVNS